MKKFIVLTLLLLMSPFSVQAVDMELKGLDGNQAKLSNYLGKWVVVNYWATWCPPCLEEMPELQAFHDDHVDKDGVVVGINTEVKDHREILTFLDDHFVSYPNFASGPTSETPLGSIPGLPTTFLLSPEGKVEARQVGGVTREMIENFIKKWEAKQAKN